MTVTITPTVEPSGGPTDPPRVRLDVANTGELYDDVTVVRRHPDGQTVPVRTAIGGQLALTDSGGGRVGLLYDYEAPFGQAVTYSTREDPGTVSGPVTVDADDVWLIHPGVPALSRAVRHFRPGSFATETWDVEQGVFKVLGRAAPVVHTSGTRTAPAGRFILGVSAPDELQAFRDLLGDTAPLLLNCSPAKGWGVDTAYIAAGAVTVARTVARVPTVPERDVEVDYQVVDRPGGGTQAERTLADLLDYPSLADLIDAYPTFLDLLAGP